MPLSAFEADFVWWPDPAAAERTNLARFMRRYGYMDLADLTPRSLEDVSRYWRAVLQDLAIQFELPFTQIADFSRGIEWPVWCVGGQMNIVSSCLDRWLDGPAAGHLAVRWEGEEGSTRRAHLRRAGG